MKPNPAPFFNYRKRQRQAILSDPSQLSASLNQGQASNNGNLVENVPKTGTSFNQSQQASASYQADNVGSSFGKRQASDSTHQNNFNTRSGLMDLSGNFNQRQTFASHSSCKPQGSFGGRGGSLKDSFYNAQSPSVRGKSSMLNARGRGRGDSKLPIWDKNQQPTHQKKSSTAAFSNDNNELMSSYSTEINGSMSRGNNNRNFSRGRGSTSAGSHSISCIAQESPAGRAVANSKSKASTSGQGRGGFYSKGQHSQPNNEQMTNPYRKKAADGRNPGDHRSAQQFDPFDPNCPVASMFNDDLKEETPQDIAIKEKKSNPKSQEVDSSMRMFTCPINTMREWMSLNVAPGLVMFEVFGIIDSAVLRTKDGAGKEFMLSDDSSKIKCIFYEIDRELPKITRGQVHRVIGSVDCKQNKFKVVSVRPAEDGERQICHYATQGSHTEMEELARLSNEP
ncbi:spermatogenesis-associated protein 22 isoform X2 [Aplysia californica]|uniref:Spermatogenesis-associated protein 22 isoform X2 n=1 Tax=Aplysia californica TaxID=6500 RepID=A0ABM0JV23_APLCA|nr:spermatogenesis-associated protein 22 isoform X2 [Aplysia californica]